VLSCILPFSIWTFCVSFSLGHLFISIRLNFGVFGTMSHYYVPVWVSSHITWAFVSFFYWTFIIVSIYFDLLFCLILYFAFFYLDLLCVIFLLDLYCVHFFWPFVLPCILTFLFRPSLCHFLLDRYLFLLDYWYLFYWTFIVSILLSPFVLSCIFPFSILTFFVSFSVGPLFIYFY